MNYKKIHDYIIERARNRKPLTGYTEKHHIIPKCMGGSDDKENLVELTAREHFIVHKLLCEIYPQERGLYYSLWCMMNGYVSEYHKRDYKISSREYQRLREKHSNLISGDNNPSKKLYVRKKLSKILSGRGNGMYGKSHTKAQKNKWKNERRGKNNPNYKNYWTDKQKNKMSKKKIEYYKNNPYMYSGANHALAKSAKCLQDDCCDNKIYDTITECAEIHNKTIANISAHCRKVYKEQKFKFV